MRVKVDWRSSSTENYKSFKKAYPQIDITLDQWKNIIYTFNENFRLYILETGDVAKLPGGIGDFSITKKKRKKTRGVNNEFINLPVDWKKTKEKGKIIYNFNYHTEGYFFGWVWFNDTARFKHSEFFAFKPARTTSRLLAHYIKTYPKCQDIYKQWNLTTGKNFNNVILP
jgi:hypothetical protein